MSLSVTQKISIRSCSAWIWSALTEHSELENWWGEDVVLESKIGGAFKEIWENDAGEEQLATGKVLALRKEQFISFTWQERIWPANALTECTIRIDDRGAERIVTVEHRGWETLPEKLQKKSMKDFEIGWSYHLQELKSYLDD